MNVDEMAAGRKLDALVAEKVMGRTICEHSKVRSVAQSCGLAMCGDLDCVGEMHYDHLPRYSTDIAAAWNVLETLQSKGWSEFKIMGNKGIIGIAFYCDTSADDIQGFDHERGSLPLSICRAALKAMKKEDP